MEDEGVPRRYLLGISSIPPEEDGDEPETDESERSRSADEASDQGD